MILPCPPHNQGTARWRSDPCRAGSCLIDCLSSAPSLCLSRPPSATVTRREIAATRIDTSFDSRADISRVVRNRHLEAFLVHRSLLVPNPCCPSGLRIHLPLLSSSVPARLEHMKTPLRPSLSIHISPVSVFLPESFLRRRRRALACVDGHQVTQLRKKVWMRLDPKLALPPAAASSAAKRELRFPR